MMRLLEVGSMDLLSTTMHLGLGRSLPVALLEVKSLLKWGNNQAKKKSEMPVVTGR